MTINIQCRPTPVQWIDDRDLVLEEVIGGEGGDIIGGEGGEALGQENVQPEILGGEAGEIIGGEGDPGERIGP